MFMICFEACLSCQNFYIQYNQQVLFNNENLKVINRFRLTGFGLNVVVSSDRFKVEVFLNERENKHTKYLKGVI